MAYDVFISHSNEDNDIALKIYNVLKDNGINCWIDRENIAAGKRWQPQVVDAIKGSKVVLFLYSKNANGSDIIPSEIAIAHKNKKSIIPLRLDNTSYSSDLEIYVGSIQRIDAFPEPIEDYIPKLEKCLAEFNINNIIEQQSSKQKTTWNLPYTQNKNFTGRADVLKIINTEFSSIDPNSASTIIISGMGGNGKTQLVNQYAYENKQRYKLIWWIRAESAVSLENDYLDLGSYFKLPDKNSMDKQTLKTLIKNKFDEARDWLLIFDNADMSDIINSIKNEYMPRLRTGNILITSRSPDWKKVGKVIKLGVFSQDESIEYITKRLGYEDGCDPSIIGDLANELGKLPLALSHACAYIDQTPEMNITKYIERFKKYQGNKKYQDKLLSMDADERKIDATWNISFDAIKKNCPAGAYLLNLCAFFAHDDIPLDLISTTPGDLPKTDEDIFTDEFLMDEAKVSLNRYSFLSIDNNVLSIHKLVQMIIRNNLTPEERNMWISSLILTMSSLLPSKYEQKENRVKILRLLPHAMNLLELAEENHIKNEKINILLESMANDLYKMSDYNRAIEYYNKAMKLYVEAGDKKGELKCYNGLGMAYRMLDDYKIAIKYLNKASELSVAIGYKKGETKSCYEIGRAYHMLGDFNNSITYLEKALKISVENDNNVDKANNLNDLGRAYHMLGDYKKAIKYQEEALAILIGIDNRWGESKCFWDLGRAYHMLGDYKKAIDYEERALAISSEIGNRWGESKCFWDLGRAYHMLGDYKKAIKYLEEALKISVEIGNKWGESNHNDDLGAIYHTMGDNKKAIEYQEKALKIATEIGNKAGEANCYNDLGRAQLMLGDTQKAIEYQEKALKIAIEMGYKPVEANCYNDLGCAQLMLGDTQKAIEYQEKALKIAECIGYKAGESNSYNCLVNIYELLGDNDKVLIYREKAQKIKS
jgi:tetratricopeptide (TPR) repeat protein